MAAQSPLISAGDVIEVQLTSETVVIDTPQGRQRVEKPGHITNRMRLFVRELDGREQKYDFEDCELGVRETQRVAIVRGRVRREPEPVNLILFNLSSGERDLFERGLARYLGYTPLFGPRWKAAAMALGVALVLWLVSRFAFNVGSMSSTALAIMFAFLLYPLLWWISGHWDRITGRIRYKRARKQFIAEMEGRVRAYAAPAAPVASAPQQAQTLQPPAPEGA
jgi:hypothetical protein